MTTKNDGVKVTTYARAQQRALAPEARAKLARLISTCNSMIGAARELRRIDGTITDDLVRDAAAPGQIISTARAEKLERALAVLP